MRWNTFQRMSLAGLAVISSSAPMHAQRATIPERLARSGISLEAGPSVPSGPAPTLDEILRDTDVVVRGVVGEPRSYLSDDQLDIYTDYPLIDPVVLYQSALVASPRPSMPSMTITLHGGKVTINGLTYTSQHGALPLVQPGSECLFLLKKDQQGRYRVAGTYYGAFSLSDGILTRLVRREDFAQEYQDAPAAQAEADILARLRSLRQ